MTKLRTKWKGKYVQTYADGFAGRRWHVLPELWWDEEAKPCKGGCDLDSHWRRPLKGGLPTHPLCESSVFDSVTDELYLECLLRPHREPRRGRAARARRAG